MSNIQKAEESVEQAKALLEKAMGQLAEAKKADERVFGFVPKKGQEYHVMSYTSPGGPGTGYLRSSLCQRMSVGNNHSDYSGLIFETSSECDEFSKAMNTFLELRTMPGVVGSERYKDQYTVYSTKDGETKVETLCNLISLAPFFKDRESAAKALDTIGEDRIKHMYRVLSGQAKE